MNNTDLTKFRKPAIIKTIVTSNLGAEIAKKHGLSVFSTLTGFKFIGEQIFFLEQKGEESRFLLGFEESCVEHYRLQTTRNERNLYAAEKENADAVNRSLEGIARLFAKKKIAHSLSFEP